MGITGIPAIPVILKSLHSDFPAKSLQFPANICSVQFYKMIDSQWDKSCVLSKKGEINMSIKVSSLRASLLVCKMDTNPEAFVQYFLKYL